MCPSTTWDDLQKRLACRFGTWLTRKDSVALKIPNGQEANRLPVNSHVRMTRKIYRWLTRRRGLDSPHSRLGPCEAVLHRFSNFRANHIE